MAGRIAVMGFHTSSSCRTAAFAPPSAIVCIGHILLLLVLASSFSSSSSSSSSSSTCLVIVAAFSSTTRTTTTRLPSHAGGGGTSSNDARDGGNNGISPRFSRRMDDGNVANVVPSTTTAITTTITTSTTTVARKRRRRRRRRRPPGTVGKAVVDVTIEEEEGIKISIGPAGSATTTPATATTTSASYPDDNERCIRHISIPIAKSDQDTILVLLRAMDWDMARNTSRRNVICKDDPNTPRNDRNRPYCMSIVMGRNMKDPAGGLSYWSARYPGVYAELRNLMSKYEPNFAYTHITLNRNLRCKRHTDGGNSGPSYIVGFGDYIGGELIVETPGGGGPEAILDLRGKLVSFDGKTQPHETCEFVGERYTVVYYASDAGSYEGGKFVDRSSWTQPRGGRSSRMRMRAS